jgi:AraC-like DNA-binding protein/integrase
MALVKRKRKGKAVWEANVYVRGAAISRKGGFSTKGAAASWHDAERSKHLDPSIRVNPYADMTLSQVFERYKTDRLPELRASTRQTQINRHWCIAQSPIFDWKMWDIDAFAIDSWLEWLKKHPSAKAKARKSFRQELNCIRAVLNWYHHYLNEKYVVPIVRRHCKAIHYKELPAKRPDYYMRVDQAQDWLHWLEKNKSNPVYYRLAKFLLMTGCRIGEASGLFWDVVVLRTFVFPVVRTVWWSHESKEPKIQDLAKNNGAIRNIAMPIAISEMLTEMKAECGIGPVFCTKPGELIRYNAVQSAFNEGFKALNLPFSSTHICRHTFATLALRATRDVSAVQAALGHDDIRQTQLYAKKSALLDGKVNNEVANLLIAERRSLTDVQTVSIIHQSRVTNPVAIEVLRLMEANVAEPLPIGELAQLAGVSLRSLQRLFKQKFERSAERVYLDIRLAHARLLVHRSEKSVREIAARTGFASPSHLTARYTPRYGASPQKDREKRAQGMASKDRLLS